MAKRKTYIPKSFESADGSRTNAAIYASMINSKAWIKLSKNARLLYMYMKLQLFGQKPIKDHPEHDFVFTWGMASKVYRLYTNQTRFRNDLGELTALGFIETVEKGKTTRTPNIYRFSDKWRSL